MPMLTYEPVRIAGSITVFATIDQVWIERPFGTLHGMALINFKRIPVWRMAEQTCWFVDLEPESVWRRRIRSLARFNADPDADTRPMPVLDARDNGAH
jgi:hypothetical protein